MSKIEMKAVLFLSVDEEDTELGSTTVLLSGLDVTNKLSKEFLSETLASFQDIMGITTEGDKNV